MLMWINETMGFEPLISEFESNHSSKCATVTNVILFFLMQEDKTQ